MNRLYFLINLIYNRMGSAGIEIVLFEPVDDALDAGVVCASDHCHLLMLLLLLLLLLLLMLMKMLLLFLLPMKMVVMMYKVVTSSIASIASSPSSLAASFFGPFNCYCC